MASSGGAAAALRHSFVTPVGTDRDRRPKTLTRTPSLPSQFGDSKPQKRSKKRPSGLFESSSESGGESSAEEPSTTATKHVSFNSRSSTRRPHEDGPPTRHPSLSANNSSSQERRGLFETEDDAGDSVESLRERVKLRQQKKESEIQSLRTQLADALAQVQAERREKDEFAIRMNECQRIIEKRNKQLIKASEKLARLAEQSDAQINELQTKAGELTAEIASVRAEEEAARERQRVQFEEKLAKHRAQFQAQMEMLTQTSADKLAVKEEAEAVLRKRITQLETDVVTAASRIAESAEYQTLLKRCEDAEAISRGLRFQLEKAQNEKKQLKKQVLASQMSGQGATGSSGSAFMPPTDFFADIAGTGTGSPASSVASGDLSNFDFFSSHPSPPQSPSAAVKPPPVSTSSSSSRKPSLKVTTDPPTTPSDKAEKSSKASSRDSRDSVYGTSTDGNDTDLPAPSPPPTQPEKTETKTRPGSGTINFFEKMTFKFKRSASSPRATAKSVDDQEPAKFPSLFGSSTPAATASTPIDIPPASGRRNVLPNRPKMYVAKSPSDYEESSDSIFGSDSESNDSSSENDDDGGDDEPPPPPSQSKSRTPPGSSSIDVNIQPPLPPLFGDPGDADSSSLSSDDEDDVGPHRRSSGLRRVVLPVPSPPKSEDKPADRVSVSSDSLSDRSESNSDTSDDEREQTSSTPPKKDQEAKSTRTTSGASSDSSASGGDERSRRQRHASNDGSGSARPVADYSSRSEKRERSRSTEAGDANAAATAKVNRMNEYMEARAKKRQEKLSKKEARESAEHKKREEYEKEWERMAQEERERRRKQQQARRTGKRRPSSMKTVRVSQMRQQMSKHHHHSKDQQGVGEDARAREDDSDDGNEPPPPGRRRSDVRSSDSDVSDNDQDDSPPAATFASSPPLPPEPSAADTELYIRQQARLRERHELEMKKRQDADEADQVRGQIHRRIEMWAFGKELLHLILTLDQISTNDALKQCQLMVVQSPDPETLRKAYRNIIRVIHPDKLRNASIAEQLEAKELFTVLNQAFEKFKAQ